MQKINEKNSQKAVDKLEKIGYIIVKDNIDYQY